MALQTEGQAHVVLALQVPGNRPQEIAVEVSFMTASDVSHIRTVGVPASLNMQLKSAAGSGMRSYATRMRMEQGEHVITAAGRRAASSRRVRSHGSEGRQSSRRMHENVKRLSKPERLPSRR